MHSKQIVNATLIQFIHVLATLIITFFLTPFMIKMLGEHNFGIWTFISTIINYFILAEFGLASALQNKLAICLGSQDTRAFGVFYSNGVLLYSLAALIIAFVVILISTIVFYGSVTSQPVVFAKLMLILGFNTSISFLFFPHLSVLISHVRLDITTLISILKITLNAILTVVVLTWGYSLVSLALVMAVTTLVSNVLIFVASRRIMPELHFSKNNLTKTHSLDLLRYSGKTFLTILGDLLRFKLDDVVTGTLISFNQVTHYAVANKIVISANDFSSKLTSILNPIFAQLYGKDAPAQFRQSFLLSFKLFNTFSIFTLAGLVILGQSFINLWLGDAYLDSYIPLIFLGIAYNVARGQSSLINILYAANRHQYYAYLNLVEGLLNLALSLVFVLYFKLGINGVALGTLIPIFVSKVFVQPYISLKIIEFPLKTYYAYLLDMWFTGVLIYGTIYLVCRYFDLDSYLDLLIVALILGILLILHYVYILDQREKALIIRAFKNVRI